MKPQLADLPLRLVFALVVFTCFAAPLAAIAWQLATKPFLWREFGLDAHGGRLLLSTVSYNALAAGGAAVLAMPAALCLGRGRASVLWWIAPLSLLMPTMAFEYGWKEALRELGVLPAAQSWGDLLRCVWTLACWLWPIPTITGALALRRVEGSMFEQAALDGALTRVTLRVLSAPMLIGSTAAFVLASQEFTVFESTGIRVVATEVRMVFETGAASTGDAIDAPRQQDRVAAAMVAAAPLTLLTLAIAGLTLLAARRWSGDAETEAQRTPSRAASVGSVWFVLACAVVLVTTGTPLAAMGRSLSGISDLPRAWAEYAPQIGGSFLLAGGAMALAAVLCAGAVARRGFATLFTGMICFLLGGQMLAIALIWGFNRDALGWAYDSPLVTMFAYVGRFGWIALLAAAMSWTGGWRRWRDLAAVDGAGRTATWTRVIVPMAWPMLAGALGLVGVLSLTEVPATMLIGPLRPQPLAPMLMTMIHIQQYDAMIRGTLLLCGLTMLAAAVVIFVFRRVGTHALPLVRSVVVMLCALTIMGCDGSDKPRAVWLQTGIGAGQVVYPRAIDYRPQDDSFVVIDRMARVQRIDSSGRYIKSWRMPDHELGKPVGVTVGPDGNIYVPDTHYQRVIVYSPDGEEIRRWGRAGRGPGEFIFPTDVAFDASGRVFVSEYGEHDRIQVFDAQGRYLFEFGRFGQGDGEFSRPQSMAFVGNLLYVTDACNHRLTVFDTDGKWIRHIGGVGTQPGRFRFPYGLAVDASGQLVVCEFGNNRVQRIDPSTGASVGLWGQAGRALGELAYPWAVALNARGDVAIVDSGNNRVQLARF